MQVFSTPSPTSRGTPYDAAHDDLVPDTNGSTDDSTAASATPPYNQAKHTDTQEPPQGLLCTNPAAGHRPAQDWVQRLGRSEVDPQGLQPRRGGQNLRMSEEALPQWGIGRGTSDSAREDRTTATPTQPQSVIEGVSLEPLSLDSTNLRHGSIKVDQGYWASLKGIANSDLSFTDKVGMAWGTTKYYFRNSDDAQGAVQMVSGGLEVFGAISLSSTGAGTALGVPLAFHGGDSIGTGFSRIMGNGDGSTVTYQGIYSLTGSATLASAVDQGTPFVAGVASMGQGLRLAEERVLRNTTYRALSSPDAAALGDRFGLKAKNPNGSWSASDHVANFNPDTYGGAAANSPWISTTRSYKVAQGYESGNGIAAVNLSKVPSAQVEVWQAAPRSSIYELTTPYHRSIWAQEVTVYRSVPSQALYTPFSPLSQVATYRPITYGMTLGSTGFINNHGDSSK